MRARKGVVASKGQQVLKVKFTNEMKEAKTS